MRAGWTSLAMVCACAGDPPVNPPVDVPDPPAATGLVTEPALGTLLPGDPASISIHVAGTYSDSTRTLSVQVLANPDDIESWTTLVTTQATAPIDAAFGFAVDIQPVTADVDRVRWPLGGVLRLRVIDDTGYALAIDPEEPTDTIVAVANPGLAPAGWTYLVENPVGSITETLDYYTVTDAPATLTDFMTRFGFPGDETNALYYNAGDLGIAREMHCRSIEIPVGGLACYVRNFGIFGGARDEALGLALAAGPPLATVAMVYRPPIDADNSVTFVVYGPDGARVNEAQLDTRGDNKSIPHNCLNCHGGRSTYDVTSHTSKNARFLAFDPIAFEFAERPDLTLASQEEKFRRLDRLIGLAAPTTAVREVIEGMFPLDNSPYDPEFVPVGWNAKPRDARVYREVVAPYCRSCHSAFESATLDPATFATADGFKAKANVIVQKVCGAGPTGMPTAEATSKLFFASPARALLLQWLERPGACAP
ncbi:MAG: hypothetical protein ABI867_21735 [Kofleriaceae bacterium]